MRQALGAGRGRVIRQLLTESMLLSFAGAALGALLTYMGATGLAAFFAANSNSLLKIDLHPDARVLIFTISIALLLGIDFGNWTNNGISETDSEHSFIAIHFAKSADFRVR